MREDTRPLVACRGDQRRRQARGPGPRPRLRFDAEGNVGAVWIEVGPDQPIRCWSAFAWTWSRRATRTSRLSLPATASATNPPAHGGRPGQLACGVDAARALPGRQRRGPRRRLAAQRPRDGTWSDPVILATDLDGGSKIAPAVAVTPDGIVFAAWTAYDVGRPRVYLAERGDRPVVCGAANRPHPCSRTRGARAFRRRRTALRCWPGSQARKATGVSTPSCFSAPR